MNAQRSVPIWKVLMVDLFLAANILLLFAYFHHVKPIQTVQPDSADTSIVIEQPKEDISFVYNIESFENSSRAILKIGAETEKEITAVTFFIEYDSEKMTFESAMPGESLLSELVTVHQNENMLTVSADIDKPGTFLFPVGTSDTDCISVIFNAAEGHSISLDDFTVSVNSARLLTTANELATFTLSNSESTVLSSNDFRSKFPDKFTDGEVIETENSYMDQNVNVTYYTKTVSTDYGDSLCHIFDIYVRSYDYLRSSIYGDKVVGASGYNRKTLTHAKEKNAIAAINGDYCCARSIGVAVRDGVLYRTEPFQDIMVMYTDGTMVAFEDGTYSNIDFSKENVWQIWSFGPSLLTADGQPKTEFTSVVCRANPRSSIGYFEPGHYCFVAVDGRGEGGSVGLTMEDFSMFYYELGCVAAYNLDGGRTSVAVWNDHVANTPYKGGRPCSDIIYIPRS